MIPASLEKLLDPTSKQLLALLQQNARLSYSELGRQVGLSVTAVIDRMRRLEDAGLITGYQVTLDREKLGLSVLAFVRLQTIPERYPAVLALVETLPAVLECHHMTGEESFILKVVVATVAELEPLIELFSKFGRTSTSIVMSSPIEKRPLPVSRNEK
ncbi:MAG: Lrp/AsnC family transcriptional regulator [Anaerolineae bacterium]|nr:Lrp/AsnC family transcriptional regulator [Anaerolineae bacterium]